MEKIPIINVEWDDERNRADTRTQNYEVHSIQKYNKAEYNFKNRIWVHKKLEIPFEDISFDLAYSIHFLLYSGLLNIYFNDEWLKLFEEKIIAYGRY